MARHDKQTQMAMDWQSHMKSAADAQCCVVTFEGVPGEVLLDIIRNQLDEARESLED